MYNRNFKYDPKKYDYAIDGSGKIRRAAKVKNENAIRFKFIEGIYKWWRARSLDTRFSIIPIGWAFLATFVIYNFSVYIFQRTEHTYIKALIPEEFGDRNKFERYHAEKLKAQEFHKLKVQEKPKNEE